MLVPIYGTCASTDAASVDSHALQRVGYCLQAALLADGTAILNQRTVVRGEAARVRRRSSIDHGQKTCLTSTRISKVKSRIHTSIDTCCALGEGTPIMKRNAVCTIRRVNVICYYTGDRSKTELTRPLSARWYHCRYFDCQTGSCHSPSTLMPASVPLEWCSHGG